MNTSMRFCNSRSTKDRSLTGFTLLELLIVVGVLAILSAVITLVLNPAELTRRARDARRLGDLRALEGAINFLVTRHALAGVPFDWDGPNYPDDSCAGQTNQRIFVSVPSDSGDIPPLPPAGWLYASTTAPLLRVIDGNGWTPLDFRATTTGPEQPLSALPVDPVNTWLNNLYYTYICGGSFELNARMESRKYREHDAAADGGDDAELLEIGTTLAIAPARPAIVEVFAINPSYGTQGKTALPATVTGKNFQAGAEVKLVQGGQFIIGSFTSVTSTAISTYFNLTGAALGKWNVMVKNPDNTYGTCINCFTVNAPLPPPHIASIDPTSGEQGVTNFPVTIRGSYFQPDVTVSFSGPNDIAVTAASVQDSGRRIDAFISIFALAASTTRSVTVSNPDGQATTTVGIFTVVEPPTTILGDGVNPSGAILAPGGFATSVDSFTFKTNTGTDDISSLTVTLAAGTYVGISKVEITNDAGSFVYGSADNPPSDTVGIVLSPQHITASTSPVQYKIRITTKSHDAMLAPPGAEYAVTSTVIDWNSSHPRKVFGDSGSAVVKIDNLSPANVTNATTTLGTNQLTVSWTNPGGDFSNVVVIRATSTLIGTAPMEGSSPSVDSVLGKGIVRYTGSASSFTDTGLAGGTAYHYRIFAKDMNGNYSAAGIETFRTTGISLVQSKACSSSGGSFMCTLNAAPQSGNTLIAVIGTRGTSTASVQGLMLGTVSSFAPATQSVKGIDATTGVTTDIWYANSVYNPNQDKVISITLQTSTLKASAIIAEYFGISTSSVPSPLDRTATNTGYGTNLSVGPAAAPAAAHEVWIAGFGAAGKPTYPSSTFTKLGEAVSTGGPPVGQISAAFLYNIVYAAGTPQADATLSAAADWAGALATFK